MILTLAACESTSPEVTVDAPPPAEDPVGTILDRAQAAASRQERARLYLDALTATFEHGDVVEAQDIAATLEPLAGDLGAAESFRYGVLAIELELTGQPPDYAHATALLTRLRPTTPAETLVVARLRARLIAGRADSPRAAALAWIVVAEHAAAEDEDVRTAAADKRGANSPG